MTTLHSPPPHWFTKAITEGFASLYALSLEGNPAADVVEATKRIWIHDLWAYLAPSTPTELDLPRIGAAFRALRLSVTRWPQPRDFLAQLRPREQPRPLALPPGDIGEAERARRILENERRRTVLNARGEDFQP